MERNKPINSTMRQHMDTSFRVKPISNIDWQTLLIVKGI